MASATDGHVQPLRRRIGRRVAALAVVAASVAAGCDESRRVGEQSFEPREPGVLTVATVLPAPAFWEGSAPSSFTGGYEWALAAALAERFGLDLEVLDLTFEQIVGGEWATEADLAIAQITATGDRDASVDFSAPYFDSDAGVLAGDDDTMLDLATARDRRWGVVRGSTEREVVNDVVRPAAPVVEYVDETECATAIAVDEIDACLVDLPTALVLEQRLDGVATVARFDTGDAWAVALPEGSDNVAVVDAGLRALDADGSLDRFADEWLTPAFGRDPSDVPLIAARMAGPG